MRLATPIAQDPALQPDLKPVKVTSPETAQTLRELMVGVVTHGTGVAAALPGVQVAGKTGTAELGPSALQPGQDASEAEQHRRMVRVLRPGGRPEAGGRGDGRQRERRRRTVAAPIARQVLATGLGLE